MKLPEVILVPLQPEDREQFILDSQKVGGVVLQIDKEAAKGELELLFVLPECHSKGIALGTDFLRMIYTV